MQSINYHGKITKRRLEKCKDICRTWCDLQYRYAEILNNTDSVINFETNVPILDSLTSDFLVLFENNTYEKYQEIEKGLLNQYKESELQAKIDLNKQIKGVLDGKRV